MKKEGEGGVGETKFTKYLCHHRKELHCSQRSAPVLNQDWMFSLRNEVGILHRFNDGVMVDPTFGQNKRFS